MNYEQFLLIKLAEEASEVAQIALKTAQFGMGDKKPGQDLTNEEWLYAELNDVNAIVSMLNVKPSIDFNFIRSAGAELTKIGKVCKYLGYSVQLGMVDAPLVKHDSGMEFVPDKAGQSCGTSIELNYVPEPPKVDISVKDNKVVVTLAEGVTMSEGAEIFFNYLNGIMPGLRRGESAEGRGDQLIGTEAATLGLLNKGDK